MQITLCVYDSKAAAFLEPIFVPTVALALRGFTAACNDEKHDFYKFGEDYTLFETGTWDPETAKSTNLATPRSIALAISVIKPAPSSGGDPPKTIDDYNDVVERDGRMYIAADEVVECSKTEHAADCRFHMSNSEGINP